MPEAHLSHNASIFGLREQLPQDHPVLLFLYPPILWIQISKGNFAVAFAFATAAAAR